MEIDLSRYAGSDIIVLSGRPMGEEIRKKLQLDEIDDRREKCTVKVPAKIVSLNSSFFLGLFAPTIKKLGETLFRENFVFNCSDEVVKDIESGIRQALNTANPLRARGK